MSLHKSTKVAFGVGERATIRKCREAVHLVILKTSWGEKKESWQQTNGNFYEPCPACDDHEEFFAKRTGGEALGGHGVITGRVRQLVGSSRERGMWRQLHSS